MSEGNFETDQIDISSAEAVLSTDPGRDTYGNGAVGMPACQVARHEDSATSSHFTP